MLTEGIAKLFCEIGYERTSIRDIAKALGVPNSALYYYFQNKQEMLFAVVDDLMERTIRNLEENSEAFPDGENKLALIIESHIRFYVENPYAGKVLMRDFNCLEGGQRDILKNKELKYINCARKVIGGDRRALRQRHRYKRSYIQPFWNVELDLPLVRSSREGFSRASCRELSEDHPDRAGRQVLSRASR